MLRPYMSSPPFSLSKKPNPEPSPALRVGEAGPSGRRHLDRDLRLAPSNVDRFPPGLCQRTVQWSQQTVAGSAAKQDSSSMTRFRVRRGAVVAVLLVLAFGVAAALAVQAYGTARYHRAQADRVLRDYAALAASRVAVRSATDIYYAVVPPLKALKHAHEMAPHKALPVPKDLHFDTMEHEFSLAPYIRFTFRM